MRKDSSQPLKVLPEHVSVIVQDEATGKYALLRSRQEWEEDICDVFELEPNRGRPVAGQIIAYLDGHGFSVTTLRELARQTEVIYSFANNAPAGTSDSVCMLAVVKRTGRDKKIIEEQKVEWVSIGKLAADLQISPYVPPTVGLGLEQLLKN